MSETASPIKTNSQRIWDAIVDCKNHNRVCTRRVICDITNLKMSIVDDHIKRLKADEKIISPVNGVFEPAENLHDDRLVTTTFLQNGKVKIELGNEVLVISMREARFMWMALGGIGLQFGR